MENHEAHIDDANFIGVWLCLDWQALPGLFDYTVKW